MVKTFWSYIFTAKRVLPLIYFKMICLPQVKRVTPFNWPLLIQIKEVFYAYPTKFFAFGCF